MEDAGRTLRGGDFAFRMLKQGVSLVQLRASMSLMRKKLRNRGQGLGTGLAGRGLSVMGVLIFAVGCHARQSGTELLERIARAGSRTTAPKPGELAEEGRAAITDECAKQSYETARKGLIVSETGMHEDVFVLRDRVSYRGVGYGLDEAQRLEGLLKVEAKVVGRPAEQADCIQEFEEHLEALSDPLVEADVRQKELDVSAFQDAAKEAQEQAEKKLRAADKVTMPKMQSPQTPE